MDIDVPEESVAPSSAIAPRRSNRKRKLGDAAKEPIVLEDARPSKKAAHARNAPSKKKTVAVDLTREDDVVQVVKGAVLTTEKNSKNNAPTAPTDEKRLKR